MGLESEEWDVMGIESKEQNVMGLESAWGMRCNGIRA